MKIVDHILVSEGGESFAIDAQKARDYGVRSPKKDSGTLHNPDTVVVHYTASLKASGSIRTLYESSTKASAHIVIDENGNIVQLMPFDKKAWHAGESQMGTRKWLNHYSIGIEIVNAGFLQEGADGELRTWFNTKVSKDRCIKLPHKYDGVERYWQTYSEAQILAVTELCEVLAREYPVKHIVGHDDISPGRKQDPGPAFPLGKVSNSVLGARDIDHEIADDRTGDTAAVSANSLNIRESASATAPKVAKPLAKGQKVKIIEERNGWYKVETTITGWVSKDFVEG